MKKTLAVILALLMLLCMVPASVFADTAEEPDEAAAIEFNHKVYEANRLDALFGRHESITYTIIFPEPFGRTGFVWETKDSVYRENGTSTAMLDRDRVVYTMESDEETGAVSVSCGVNIGPDYNPFYSFLPDTEETFFNPARDHVTRIWEEDGMIFSTTQSDETMSREIVEDDLGLEYTGQTVRTEIIVDPETFEVLKIVDTMEQDGAETVLCVIDAAYDLPEPLACRTLRACFERESENTMTVSISVDPGTEHAFSRALTAPVNMEAGMMFGDVPVVYFNDPECETLTHWDRMSDLDMYVFTNPNEELTAKFQTLYEKLVQEMQSAEPDAAEFEKLVAANSGNEVLSRHENLKITRTTFRDGEEILTETNYRDAGVYYWTSSDGTAMLHLPDLWVDRSRYDGEFIYDEVIFDTLEACEADFANAIGNLVFIPEQEKLVETKNTDDGRIVAVTEVTDGEYITYLLENTLSVDGYAYAEGMTLRYEYTFDAETFDQLSMDAYLTGPEGEARLWQRDSYAYDVEPYDPFAEGEPFMEYQAAATDPEQSGTITVIFDPDTENEHVVVYNMPRKTYFYIFRDGRYAEECYTDRACTQLFEGGDGVSDLELYVR